MGLQHGFTPMHTDFQPATGDWQLTTVFIYHGDTEGPEGNP